MNQDFSSRFDYKSKLGQGAFGCAFLVERKSNKLLYVIKEQYGIIFNNQTMWNEAELLRKMRHPNIISYYGAWRNGNTMCLLMEYCSGGTLHDFLVRHNRPMREEHALYLFAQIVLGVRHIHNKFVLHRHLKPTNIMLHGARLDIVKIGDFGIAKNIAAEAAQTVIGTKLYMAPEVLRGSIYEFKCDIWSVGIILFEMITNRFPFDYHNQMKMMLEINRGLSGRVPTSVSPHSTNHLNSMIHKDAHKRPSANDLTTLPIIERAMCQISLNQLHDKIASLNSKLIK